MSIIQWYPFFTVLLHCTIHSTHSLYLLLLLYSSSSTSTWTMNAEKDFLWQSKISAFVHFTFLPTFSKLPNSAFSLLLPGGSQKVLFVWRLSKGLKTKEKKITAVIREIPAYLVFHSLYEFSTKIKITR